MAPAFKRNPAEGEFLAKREIEVGEGLVCGGCNKCTKDVMQHMFGTHPCLPASAIRRIYEAIELEYMVQTREADEDPEVESARGWTRPSAKCIRALGLDPKLFVYHLPKSWTASQPLKYKNWDGAVVDHGYLYDLIEKVNLGNNIPKNVQHPSGRKVDHHVSNYTEARYEKLMPEHMTNHDMWLIIKKERLLRDFFQKKPTVALKTVKATPEEIRAYKAKEKSDGEDFAGHPFARRDPVVVQANMERQAAKKKQEAAKPTKADNDEGEDGTPNGNSADGIADEGNPTPVTPQANKKQKANA